MNSTKTTSGGYAGSYMNTTTLPAIATKLQNVLGSHLIKRNVILSNAVNTSAISPGCSSWTGASSGWGAYDAYCTLMSEVQVYGSCIWGGGYDVGEACEKLPIFNFINFNQYDCTGFWFRAVAKSTAFSAADYYGYPADWAASNSAPIRPLIYIR